MSNVTVQTEPIPGEERKATDGETVVDSMAPRNLEDGCTQEVATLDPAEIGALPEETTDNIVNRRRVNDARYLNKFFEAINVELPVGGVFVGSAETSEQRKKRILNKFPAGIAWPYYVLDFIFKRVFPKLPLTKQFYFWLTNGRNRVLSKAEILGRLVCCGFEIIQHEERENRLHFAVRKTSDPAYDMNPSYGPLFTMKRYGKEGEIIHVYKLRTMHPYAEYLQEYVYSQNGLADSGKFKDDFRITTWGRFFRQWWIDEIPMFINWFKGEMKLVGVRPLSAHYRSLYPSDLLEQRDQHRPGLVPPYYADLPDDFDEVLASERRYLDAYEERPFQTDVRYFFRAVYNILFRRARSE